MESKDAPIKLETEKHFQFKKEMGKFVRIGREIFPRAAEAHLYYVGLLQQRAKLVPGIKNAMDFIDSAFKDIDLLDEEIKRVALHIPEMKETAKKEWEKRQKEINKQLAKGPVAQKPLINAEVKDPAAPDKKYPVEPEGTDATETKAAT